MPQPTTIEWQTISTAPRDGTPILVYAPERDETKITVAQFLDGDWYDYYRDEDGCSPKWPIEREVTHWMPLPEPPKE